MNVELRKPRGLACWLRIYGLYREAFPPAERKPFPIIVKMYEAGRTDIWCVYREGRFAGMATTVNGKDMVLLDYFAVQKHLRGSGIGTQALKALLERYLDRGLFLEIEEVCGNGPGSSLRERRKQFYLAAGLTPLNVSARVFGVEMELLGIRCSMDFEGYRNFYRDFYSPWAAEHIEPI